MQSLKSRLIVSIAVASLCLVGLMAIVMFTTFSKANAQDAQNSTVRDLITTLDARVKSDSTFAFNINVPYSFYNHKETFTVDDTSTKIVEIGDDHVCMDALGSTTTQTFCYPYATIAIVYPIDRSK